jgi:hypothetical protein
LSLLQTSDDEMMRGVVQAKRAEHGVEVRRQATLMGSLVVRLFGLERNCRQCLGYLSVLGEGGYFCGHSL